MATALHFGGIKTPKSIVLWNSLQSRPLWPQQLRCAASIPSSSLFNYSIKVGHVNKVFRVCCKENVDVIEKANTVNQNFCDAENQLTCVMKFGGSSVASADRMREVADLILSFPNERPVIVLSAMGKTTNNLLMVVMNSQSCFYVICSSF